MEQPVCDFCHTTPVVWTYPCNSFSLGMALVNENTEVVEAEVVNSIADWAACEGCRALIDADRWDAMIERALASFVTRHGLDLNDQKQVSFFRDGLTHLFGGFQANRRGTGIRYEEPKEAD